MEITPITNRKELHIEEKNDTKWNWMSPIFLEMDSEFQICGCMDVKYT